MHKRKLTYAHLVAGLMACSTLLSTLLPTANTLAAKTQNPQPSNNSNGQAENVSSKPMSSKTDFTKTASLSNKPSSASDESFLASSGATLSSSSSSASSSANVHKQSASATNRKSKAKKTNHKHKDKSKKAGQVTFDYIYNGRVVGEKTHNVKVGSKISTARMPSSLRKQYKATSIKDIHVSTPSSISARVNLQQIAKSDREETRSYNHSYVHDYEPARDVTPLPSKQYTEPRAEQGHVVNPMLRPDYAPHLHSASQFKSEVPMTSSDSPRDLKDIKPFGNLSASVLRYKPYMDKVCEHYHMTQYEDLMLAIMQCESGGHGRDVMQSSESLGLQAGSLDPQQSIEEAVRYMSKIVNKAKKMDHAEQSNKQVPKHDYHYYANDNRLLAQTYNFGGNFMDYVAKQKHGYNLSVAQSYSKNVVAPRLGNSDGSTYTYDNPISRMYHKTFLYTNGGNFFYGDLVEQYAVGGFMRPMMNTLIKHAGHKYVFGNSKGFDCAGLVSYGFKTLGVNLPSYISSQWRATHKVSGGLNAGQPGDLVFFKGTYGSPKTLSHVGLLLDRHTMFSSASNGTGFHNLDNGYWRKHLAGVRRVPQASELNAKANAKLDKLAEQVAKGHMTKALKLGAISTTASFSPTSSSTASGTHFLPSAAPAKAKKYMHSPEKVGMQYGSAEGWSDPGNQCVNFSNSYFRAIWGQHKDFVFGNGIDMAKGWSHVMKGSLSETPHAGAIASTSDVGLTGGNPAGHTFVVQHVYADGSILVAEENWPGESGSDNSTENDWDYAILPASIADNNTEYFMPSKAKYHLKWNR